MAGSWAQGSPLDQMGCQELRGLANALGKEEGSVSGTVTGGFNTGTSYPGMLQL